MRHALILVLFVFCSDAFADEAWEFVSGIKDPDIKEVCADPGKEGVLYACSEKNLYKTEDSGLTWKTVFLAKGESDVINFIGISGGAVFVCTERGVFKSDSGVSGWSKVFKGVGDLESNALHIAFSEKGIVYLGTKAGLFTSRDGGLTWKKDTGGAGNISVKWTAFLKEEVFLAAENGVYRFSGPGWERVFVTLTEDAGYDSDSADDAIAATRPVNSLLVRKGTVYLATDEGIFLSKDDGHGWSRMVSEGLISQKVNRLLFEKGLYAATDKGAFIFSGRDDEAWQGLYQGMAGHKVSSMEADAKGFVWAATNKGLYRYAPKDFSLSRKDMDEKIKKDMLNMFYKEPGIRDVQDAAIKYAEVHPDKIKSWRKAAKNKALLPSVSVGLDRYVTDLYHWDAGQNPDSLQRGDDVITWDITMNWDLGELIWNDDQTGIDTRSRLMVQLRDDILDEITRTYFERRRLQLEMHLSSDMGLKEKMENELRVQELTADLDALTGGYFSSHSP